MLDTTRATGSTRTLMTHHKGSTINAIIAVTLLVIFFISYVMRANGEDTGIQTDSSDRTVMTAAGDIIHIELLHTVDTTQTEIDAVVLDLIPNSTPIQAYDLLGFVRDSPVTIHYNPVNAPPTLAHTEVQSAIQDALEAWEMITPNLQTGYGGTTLIETSMCLGAVIDNFDTIHWTDAGGGIIGTACWSPSNLYGGCDITLSPYWLDPNNGWNIDLQTIMLHEAGHCMGLAHSDATGAVMNPSYGGPQHQPGLDDIAGVCALYGGCVGSPTETPSPSPTVSETSTPSPTATPPAPSPTPTPTPAIFYAIVPAITQN